MSDRTAAATIKYNRYLTLAKESLARGFKSKAQQQDARNFTAYAYDALRGMANDNILALARATFPEWNNRREGGLPPKGYIKYVEFLHQQYLPVRVHNLVARHVLICDRAGYSVEIRDLMATRKIIQISLIDNSTDPDNIDVYLRRAAE